MAGHFDCTPASFRQPCGSEHLQGIWTTFSIEFTIVSRLRWDVLGTVSFEFFETAGCRVRAPRIDLNLSPEIVGTVS
jgi:hypothetical protein